MGIRKCLLTGTVFKKDMLKNKADDLRAELAHLTLSDAY
ncbi:hypothetical protein VR7878_02335 [Vibrio ruber DSM 16370]|uniref:Uncharacterized protein n=1 Tax=Vibrio ruber (strain DSM 16370 / JCM 11486 / BCRC 17186 / CECT 7878 / LMG 23124 / VR1) TaxID=1123498 RepID=A0A1R4LLK1_VIBR1|nr:hypothetical protein VR7878_02335 [Vibrio ruber DSM 16370]